MFVNELKLNSNSHLNFSVMKTTTLTKSQVQHLSGPGLSAFFSITDAWKLSKVEQMILLGEPGKTTFYKWQKDPQSALLSKDTLERISYILGIYKALAILLPDNTAADSWIKKPNTAALFGGKSALNRMLSGNVSDLFVVRSYLDAMRGG